MTGAGEEILILKAQTGDREALGELLLSHQAACYAFALRLTRHADEAEDVCQDAFLRASRDIAGYRPIGSFRSWLFGLVAHAYGDRRDSERARHKREEDQAVENQNKIVDGPALTEQLGVSGEAQCAHGV
jgi:RNA polymerase sigma-70 factor (ECF subfamily)